MNLLTVLGCIGGIVYLINWICVEILAIIKAKNKYDKYKRAYEDAYDENEEEKPAKKMGFKSSKEKADEELEELRKKYLEDYIRIKEQIKINNSGYFDMHWESNPVDDEFIEEEEYEDWEDKYPDLHIER